jgi:hypothetical protein
MASRSPVLAKRFGQIVATVTFVLVAGATGAARAQTAPGPKRMAYDPDRPVPAGYHVEHRTRDGLVISGLILFGIVYVPTAAAAWYDSGDGTPLYVVPVLGPLFAIPTKTGDPCVAMDHSPCYDFDAFIAAFLVADALVQAGGLLMAWRGWAGRDILVRNDASGPVVLPGPVGATGYGAWLTGRF